MRCMPTRGVHRLRRSTFCGRCCCRCFTRWARSGCWCRPGHGRCDVEPCGVFQKPRPATDLRCGATVLCGSEPAGQTLQCGEFQRVPRCDDEAVVRVRQVHRQVVRLPFHSGNDLQCFAEVRLRLPCRIQQRHEPLPAALLLSAHRLAHDAVAAREPMLFSEPVENPLVGVSLLGRLRLILFQNGVDDTHPPPQLGPLHRMLSLITRRHRIPQHLPHHVPRDRRKYLEPPQLPA